MADKLAVRIRVTIGGRLYENGADPASPGHVISIEIEHRDQEASRLTLRVKDFDLDSDVPFREFNSIPNPRVNLSIPVVAYLGWDGEELVKVFEGLLVAKDMQYQLSQTCFVAIHEAFKLRVKGKVDALKELTIKQFLIKKGAEEGIDVQFHSSVAGDEALNTPAEVIFQDGVTNWKVMFRQIRDLGYIANTVKRNVIVIRRDKADGTEVNLKRGDDWIKSVRVRQEHRKDGRSGRRKGHSHEAKPGKFSHHKHDEEKGRSRNVRPVPPVLPRKATQHKVPFSRFSVKGKSKRYRVEGDQLTCEFRLKPEMRNEERVNLSDFGAQIDGVWQTSCVTHRAGHEPATTSVECWKP
jgi:hypothetical protein